MKRNQRHLLLRSRIRVEIGLKMVAIEVVVVLEQVDLLILIEGMTVEMPTLLFDKKWVAEKDLIRSIDLRLVEVHTVVIVLGQDVLMIALTVAPHFRQAVMVVREETLDRVW